MTHVNEFDQPVGRPMSGWQAPPMIPHIMLRGSFATVRPLQPDHAGEVFTALADADDELWTYMSFGPFTSSADLEATFRSLLAFPDWRPYVIDVGGNIEGFASYLRITPKDGVIEIGSIVYSPRLQRTAAATEAMYLMIKHAFDSGYRRVEWKCDDLNMPSRRAAVRLGFSYEGTFRNATHYKGRNRDTAWYAITLEEWDSIRLAFEEWFDPGNFDSAGRQVASLATHRISEPR